MRFSCDRRHCRLFIRERCLRLVAKRNRLVSMIKSGALTMVVVTVLWAVAPALACLLPANQMTPAEHECCERMAGQCGAAVMPSDHTCCQHPKHGEAAVNLTPTYPPTRHFIVAVIPQSGLGPFESDPIWKHSPALDVDPATASPGCSSVLRI